MAEELIERLKTTTDYYEILEVSRTATEKEVKVSYRRKALLLHPDRCSLPDAKDAFQKLSNAHMCLTDPDKRKRYDVSGSDAEIPNPFAGGGAAGHPFAGFQGFRTAGTGGIPPEFFEHIFQAAQQQGGGRGRPSFFSSSGFPGGATFSFGQPRTRRRRRQRNETKSGDAQGEAAARPTVIPADIQNSWLFRTAKHFFGNAPSEVTQFLGILMVLLGIVIFTNVLSRHLYPLMLCVFFSSASGMIYLRCRCLLCVIWVLLFHVAHSQDSSG